MSLLRIGRCRRHGRWFKLLLLFWIIDRIFSTRWRICRLRSYCSLYDVFRIRISSASLGLCLTRLRNPHLCPKGCATSPAGGSCLNITSNKPTLGCRRALERFRWHFSVGQTQLGKMPPLSSLTNLPSPDTSIISQDWSCFSSCRYAWWEHQWGHEESLLENLPKSSCNLSTPLPMLFRVKPPIATLWLYWKKQVGCRGRVGSHRCRLSAICLCKATWRSSSWFNFASEAGRGWLFFEVSRQELPSLPRNSSLLRTLVWCCWD